MIAPPQTEIPELSGPVLLFDGECGLCQRIVRRLLRIDRAGRLYFAPLQGAAAQEFLRGRGLPTADFDTLIFVPDWRSRTHGPFLVRTDGVIAALRATGRGVARTVAALLAVFPAGLRDAGYRGVARWRYRLFGPWRAGPALAASGPERFLD